MSEDKTADTVETAPAEAIAIPNGKGHEASEEIMALSTTPPAEEDEKWVWSYLTSTAGGPLRVIGVDHWFVWLNVWHAGNDCVSSEIWDSVELLSEQAPHCQPSISYTVLFLPLVVSLIMSPICLGVIV